MLKLPKGLKKKKKGKKSKRKGEDDLFTEEELDKYRKEHQQPADTGEPSKENEEWSKFKDLTTGIDSVLRKTQGDLDRIKSTSFFQRVPAGVRAPAPPPPPTPHQRVAQVTAADFPRLVAEAEAEASSAAPSDSEDEPDDQDDIFDTSYVEAVERGEVRLACVPDSPDAAQDDDLFDTSHLDALIKGQDPRASKGKKGLDIGNAVEVLTGRIDNVTVTSRRSKRVIPGDLLLESENREYAPSPVVVASEPQEKSILDTDSDVPITTPIDLSVSLHTSLIQQNQQVEPKVNQVPQPEEEDDEFTLLAAESLEVGAEVTKFEQKEITAEPVLQESWSVFEADKNSEVFAEGVAEDQIDVVDPYGDQDDPFDTSFADAVVPPAAKFQKEAVILEDDDDFDPRAEENCARLNNRRKSSVRIHLTDPSGIRESITSDDSVVKEVPEVSRDLLGGSTTDLTQLGDSPLNPVDINESDIDPFDTTIVDKIVAPGKVELKLLEQELIGASPAPVYRVPSDPDFDPRAEEPPPERSERRASRPENLAYSKSVVFNVDASLEPYKPKTVKPVTPYYTREVSITEDLSEEAEAADSVPETLTRTRSDEDLAPKVNYQAKRRYSELPQTSQNKSKQKSLLESGHSEIRAKVLTPSEPSPKSVAEDVDIDPFDTTFAGELAPTKTELKLLAKEFSCDDTNEPEGPKDLLDPSDDIFQIKALTPEPSNFSRLPEEELDPFDTSFASDLQPGRTELKLLESEFLK